MSIQSEETLAGLRAAGDHPILRSYVHGAMLLFDDTLTVLAASTSAMDHLGISRADLEGGSALAFLGEHAAAESEPHFWNALRGRCDSIDVPCNGRILSVSLTPVRNSSEQVVAGMAVTVDVTKTRAVQRAPGDSEARSRLNFDITPIAQAIVDFNGRMARVNGAFTRLLGYSNGDLRDRKIQDITHADDVAAEMSMLARLAIGDIDSCNVEKRFASITGAVIRVSQTACLVRNSDADPGYVMLQIQDISERNQVEAAIKDTIAMLAHDLRTPMSVVTGFAEVALDDWDTLRDDERKDFLQKISVAAQSVQTLLEDTLTVSALDAYAIQAHPVPVRLNQGIHAALALQVQDPGAVAVFCDGIVAFVDPGHFSQVVSNLVGNAVKYGSGPITIRAATRADQVVVRVSDVGAGVPLDFIPRLFDRFARSHEARVGRQRGTGLGLYIVRRLVELNGGKAWYEGTPGGGATFCVSFPSAASMPQ